MTWYQLEPDAVIQQLKTDVAAGLSEAEASSRRSESGLNELVGTGIRNPWLILWEQVTELMVVILIIAAVLSALLGDYKDAVAIGAIVVLNAILGFTQEYRAEQAMAALKKLAVPSVRVRRDGKVAEILASQLVPGDIFLLEEGNLVAADSRILEGAGLQTHEAALTGESEPISKLTSAMTGTDLPLGDRLNMAFMGTAVAAGRGVAVVTDTGMRTELGRIANMIQAVRREPTPLQRRLAQLGKGLAAVALVLVGIIFLLGLIRGEELKLLFLTAVSIAVAAVPEGLPAVVTIALTLGAQRMLKRRVLIRKLPAVETLGSITVICSDKTGTLTQNRMTAAVLELPGETLDLASEEALANAAQSSFGLLLAAGALCNDAVLNASDNSSTAIGDPTETALVTAAARAKLFKGDLDRQLPRVGEVPFSSERKRMTTVHKLPGGPGELPFALNTEASLSSSHIAFTKGGFDNLLNLSSAVWVSGRSESLTPKWRGVLTERHLGLAEKGMRILGVGFRFLDGASSDPSLEQDLTLIGLVGIIDPARTEVAAAVAKCKAAGIRPVMITGDHPLTALHIASQLGISSGDEVLAGPELDTLSIGELEQRAQSVQVYARVSPEHKLKIIEGLQRRGDIVAMTGDGVNDAPALKKADIGVAMGITGTDVAKEAADMVLLDDNFATIVDAVEEGRVIYDNIRKFIRYILATNAGEIWLMLVAPLLGMPLPLLPLQILWMNLVTDGFPALALGIEAPEPDTMSRPPYPPNEKIFARGLGLHVVWVGILMGLVSLVPGFWYWKAGDPNWQTLLFTTITLSQMAHVLAIRSDRHSLFKIGLFSNKPLLAAVILTLVLQMGLLYVPFLQAFFKTRALPLPDLALTFAMSSIIFVAVEFEKWLRRRPLNS